MADIREIETTITTRRQHTVRLNRKMLLDALRRHWLLDDLPDDVCITVTVPGGGDWSNTTLDIDDETPICVEWSTQSTEME